MTNKEKIKLLAEIEMSKYNPTLELIKDSPGNQYFFDQFSGLFFKSNQATVLAAELNVNRELILTGRCPLRYYYNILGLDVYKDAEFDVDNFSWELDGITNWIDFDYIYMDRDTNFKYGTYHLIVMLNEPNILL